MKVILDGVDEQQLGLEYQDDAEIIQPNPGTGTKYEVLDVSAKKVRIYHIFVRTTWTVQPDPLEVHLTIDGIAKTFTFNNPVSNQWYMAVYDQTLDTTWAAQRNRAFFKDGRAAKVEVEITGGTVSELRATVEYAKK